ncbi:LPS-assembly lipoprotein LptE [Taylorella equigenitalis]|uniref:LPS-assembly lipoprotein LptE n=1 Tax=Taylorella equigenitalis TaxID=29575 RepID=UPI00040EAD6C|nr:LPS assembly lipoprotein LptE [Taylorella equigenitalis]ASY37622.1 hypothetical protein CA605_02735 [Taylorella equigenitalis]ASY42045.1 hypothetical protein CA943_02745 [Taylorella equigenitalis]KGK33194.1 lipoprotein [Taylorella equigenitalis]RBA26357.1 hypothetical protein DQW13_04960 [Taylorella equigenitalis]
MRSEVELPFSTIYSELNTQERFGVMLKRMLKARSPNLKFIDDPKLADIILETKGLSKARTPLSLDPDGKVEEYELYVSLEFKLLSNKGEVLVPKTLIKTTRIIPYNILESNAGDKETEFLYEDMEKEIASKLFGRITASELSEKFKNKK